MTGPEARETAEKRAEELNLGLDNCPTPEIEFGLSDKDKLNDQTERERQEREKDPAMNEKFDSKDSFIRGYNYGAAQKRELSPREIAQQFPDVEPDSFHNGNVDGIEGDRFRLDLTLGQLSLA